MSDATKVKQFGLTKLYQSVEEPLVDIVFVHGLNGHPRNTWTSPSGVFWPADLLPGILARKRVRILTYGYNANVTAFTDGASKDHLHNHAETLAAQLAANRNLQQCLERPIVFVCHSLGGLVVKRALLYCRSVTSEKLENLRSIYVSTYGILFLGTPHNGSDVAKWGHLLQNICSAVLPKKFMDSSPQLIKALKANNELLQNINLLFVDIVPRFHIYFFHETKPMDIKGTREIIVDETSAAPVLEGVERMGIEADHSHMCKFDDENAPGFEAVAEALFRYSDHAPATVAGRWLEEKQTRRLEKEAKAHEILSCSSVEGVMSENLVPTGRTRHFLPAPGSVATLSDDDVEGVDSYGKTPVSDQADPPFYVGGAIAYFSSPHSGGKSSPASPLARSSELEGSRLIQREPLFVAPAGFHPNAAFVGMEKELTELHTRLFKAKKRAQRLVAVLICGPPGCGKSHLARQYVYTHRADYPGGIFWVDAKSRQSTAKCFLEIAEAAALADGKDFPASEWTASGTHVDAVRKWFESREEWLLVFDGLSFDKDEEITYFKQFLPFRKNCSIIYTSKDQTLRKKQRLFEPYCLHVRPLGVDDACRLLFKDLGIKKPTPKQMQKATELVEHYQCLPLAIHAIGHRLSATAKPIEKYHIRSHLTDGRLAEPILGIMHDLYREGHFEALSLINLLSFFGHRVPVGLIKLGRAALEAWNVEILASSRSGDRRDIDTTLGILIRYGLIGRVYHPYGSSHTTPELSESPQKEGGPETAFSSVHQSSLDVIKVHSVVQGFCRDELKIMDRERQITETPRGRGVEGGLQYAGYYDSWLVVAVGVFCKSYENAHGRMKGDPGTVKDYREYGTHAERLVEHFPKTLDKAPYIVREARGNLQMAIESINAEIEMWPNSSQDSFRQKSVFDRSSSSSSSVPESSSLDEGPSRRSTWDQDPETGVVRVESPQRLIPQHRVNLGLFPPHIYREAPLHIYRENDDGYETDGEALAQTTQVTKPQPLPALRQQAPPEEEGWEIVRRNSKFSPPERRRRHRGRISRNLGEYRPMQPLARLSSVQAKGSSSRMPGSAGHMPSPLGSEAETLLAAFHHSSPPPSRAGIKAVGRSALQKENDQTYATVAAKSPRPATIPSGRSSPSPGPGIMPPFVRGLETNSSRESLRSRSSNVQLSPLSEFRFDKLTQSTHSEPAALGFPLPPSSALDPKSAPGSRFHSRHPSARHSDILTSPPVEPNVPPLPYERDLAMIPSHRVHSASRPSNVAPGPTGHSPKPVAHPSAIMPGTSPPVAGYSSEPLSRDASAQSYQSLQTEPVRFPPRYSPMSPMGPPTIETTPPDGLTTVPQQHIVSGAGGWAAGPFDENTALPHQPDAAPYVAGGMSRPGAGAADHQLARIECGGEPQLLTLGDYTINVRDARQRVRDWERQHQLQAAAPRHVPPYGPDPASPQVGARQGTLQDQDPNRRGSSPSRDVGLGLRL